jgi:dynein heavy chain
VDRIDAIWQKTEFDLDKYKERDFILTGINKVVVILDESLSEIQDILGSRYVKRLIVKVQKLADDLLIVSDTIEAWRECQRNWLYLENIFSSKDIRQQRSKDYQDFDNVNKAWNKIMRKVSNSKKVIKNCNEKQLREFIKYNEQMDRIQKNLDQFLEEKRTDFPRFYFISSDELLQLLAEQKVVSSVEKHLNKCFDNV